MNNNSDRQGTRRVESKQTSITAEDIKVHLRESAAVEVPLCNSPPRFVALFAVSKSMRIGIGNGSAPPHGRSLDMLRQVYGDGRSP
jgi:hypothetical protein